jgi:enoyl-CoA hydratase
MIECSVDGSIATVTLANPPINALSRPWADRFHQFLDKLEARDDWRVLRIRSTLRVFSAGGDIKQFADRLADPAAGQMLSDEAAHYQGLFTRIERLPQISIAEIGGVAAGGGFELALCCDLRIAARSARVGLPEVGLGLLPSAGGTQRMAQLAGRGRALRFIGGAELLSAQDAHAAALIEWVLADEGFEDAALAIAAQLAAQPLEALRTAKSCIAAAFDPGRDGSAEEIAAPVMLMNTTETRASIQAFLAKTAKRN